MRCMGNVKHGLQREKEEIWRNFRSEMKAMAGSGALEATRPKACQDSAYTCRAVAVPTGCFVRCALTLADAPPQTQLRDGRNKLIPVGLINGSHGPQLPAHCRLMRLSGHLTHVEKSRDDELLGIVAARNDGGGSWRPRLSTGSGPSPQPARLDIRRAPSFIVLRTGFLKSPSARRDRGILASATRRAREGWKLSCLASPSVP